MVRVAEPPRWRPPKGRSMGAAAGAHAHSRHPRAVLLYTRVRAEAALLLLLLKSQGI